MQRQGDPQPVECVPPLDVTETAEAIEIVVDLPGVAADAVVVVVRDGTVTVSGSKQPSRCRSKAAAFHLAERSFGGFARTVRIPGAVDAGRASVTFVDGELRIVLPRLEERRGREIRLTVPQGPAA